MFRSANGSLDSAAFAQSMRQEEEGGGRRFESRRFYCADDELIHSEGRTYAFTNQWGANFLTAINNLKQAFPEHPIQYTESEDEA